MSKNYATPASDATMEQRLADAKKELKKAERRIVNKKATVARLEQKVEALTQQRSGAKLASTRDMELIAEYGRQIRKWEADIKTESIFHDQLCKDLQKLINMKNEISEAELLRKVGEMIREIGELMKEDPADDGSDGENGENGEGEDV